MLLELRGHNILYWNALFYYNKFMRQSYYTLTAPIRPGWRLPFPQSIGRRGDSIVGSTGNKSPNPKSWPDPPHVFFANLGYDHRLATAEEIVKFVKHYGQLLTHPGTDSPAGDRFEVSINGFGRLQEKIRHAWLRKETKPLWFAEGFEEFEQYNLPLFWASDSLQPTDCWTFMCLLLTRDLSEGLARICPNPTCNTPYFVAKRNNQKFCEWKCANVVAQRNFRKGRA